MPAVDIQREWYRPHYKLEAWIRGVRDDDEDHLQSEITDALHDMGIGTEGVVVYRIYPTSDYLT